MASGIPAPLPTLGVNEAPFLDVSKSPVLLETCAGFGPPVNGILAGSPIALLVDVASSPSDGVDNVMDTDGLEFDQPSWYGLGIALVGVGTGGSWYYTTNNCATWTVVPAVSIASSLLLAADANTRLYFNATTAVGDVTIQFRAWDRSSGTNGGVVNTTTNGGSTAFSINIDDATCYVFGVRQVASISSTASNIVSVPALINAQVGDLKILIVATSTAQPVTTTDFTTLVDQQQSSPTTSRLYIGWRFVTASEPVYSVTLGGSTAYVASAVALPGISSSAPGPAPVFASQPTAAAFSHTAPAILPTVLPALVMSIHEFANSTTWTPPTGLTEDVDRSSNGANALGVCMEVNHVYRTVAGTAGPYTAQAANTFAADAGAAATVDWLLRNSAPMLDNSRSPVLNNAAANAPPPVGPVGTLVSALIDPANTAGGLDNLHDLNASAYGIAVTAAYVANGSWYYSLNNGGTWNAMGIPSNTVARLLAADAGTRLFFQPSPNFSTTVPSAITFRAWDMTTGTNGATANPSVNGGTTAFSTAKDVASMAFVQNMAPVNAVPAPATTDEDLPIMFSSLDGTAFSVSDPDAGPSTVRVSLSVTNGSGTLTLAGTFGITVTAGADNSASITFTGPIAYINAALDGLLYSPAPNYNGATSLTITTNDLGNTGGGGPLSDVDVVTINVSAVNDPPMNTVPFQQTTPMNMPLIFSQGNGNALSVADVDAGTSAIEVTLSAMNGTLTIAGITGLGFTVGDGSADGTMTFTGTIGAVNAAIGTLTFSPAVDYGGAASLTIATNDQGNTGSGGAWTSTAQVDITVTTTFVAVSPRVMLEGPYSSGTGLMGDALRGTGLVPILEPYSALGYAHVGGGGETTTAPVLAVTGNDAPVDWVVVELRSVGDPAVVVATRSALLQRDGDVVAADGTSAVVFPLSANNFYVAVRHRNHLGVMTEASVALNTSPALVDFTSAATATFGTDARRTINGTFPVQALWLGDVSFNKVVKYTGSGNDRDPILVAVGSINPSNVVTGQYRMEDVNMDGVVQYTGSGNDRDRILVVVGSTTPNSLRVEQLP